MAGWFGFIDFFGVIYWMLGSRSRYRQRCVDRTCASRAVCVRTIGRFRSPHAANLPPCWGLGWHEVDIRVSHFLEEIVRQLRPSWLSSLFGTANASDLALKWGVLQSPMRGSNAKGTPMRVSIFPENGEWLLVLNYAEESHASVEADTSHAASSFDRCWSGDDWTEMPANGQRFESKEEALAYLDDHWQRLQNQATGLDDPIHVGFPIRGL